MYMGKQITKPESTIPIGWIFRCKKCSLKTSHELIIRGETYPVCKTCIKRSKLNIVRLNPHLCVASI